MEIDNGIDRLVENKHKNAEPKIKVNRAKHNETRKSK